MFKYCVTRLPSDRGFSYNLIPPKKDRYAYEVAKEVFSARVVDNLEKVLHRSEITYDRMVEDLFGYDRKHAPSSRSNDVYKLIRETVREDLKPMRGSLIPLTMGSVPARPDFPGSKSPGLPYKLHGYKTKREVLDDGHLHHINRLWQDVGRGKHRHLADVCLFSRAQIAKVDSHKIRATWGYPIAVYLEEGRFFYPMQDKIKAREHNLPIAYGFETAHGGMAQVNDMLDRNRGRIFACTDWKGFDKTIPPWLIRDVFSIISECFDMTKVQDVDGKIWDVNDQISWRRWKKMVDYFVETPIRTCKGERFRITGGVPSGSCWTNLVDSIINILVSRFCVYQTSGSLPLDEIYLGDDGVMILSGTVNLEDIASVAEKYFGMELNVRKSYITTRPDNVHFLGYFNLWGYPFKPMDYLLASFINPEHTRLTTIDACAAALGQLWSSFDPVYATQWYEVIQKLALREPGITDAQIISHLQANSFRHKYLQHVGLSATSITVPIPYDSFVPEVIPPITHRQLLKERRYNLQILWDQVREN